MAQSQVRVVGSNYTTFRWRGQNIAYLEGVSDQGVTPIAQPQAIMPLGENRPTEYITARATNGGSMVLTIKELWDKPVWQHLFGLASAQNIIDVWDLLAQDPSNVQCQTIIKPPTGNYFRVKTYHNVVVGSIDDGEEITLGQMSINRRINCLYTHATRDIVSAS
jgi:hypothetical protein